MALPRSFAGLARLALSPSRPYTVRIARLSSGCTPKDLPPCPPCEPKPRPSCRACPPRTIKACKKTCCPPPKGSRPPCSPREPACSLNCSNANSPPDYLNIPLKNSVSPDVTSKGGWKPAEGGWKPAEGGWKPAEGGWKLARNAHSVSPDVTSKGGWKPAEGGWKPARNAHSVSPDVTSKGGWKPAEGGWKPARNAHSVSPDVTSKGGWKPAEGGWKPAENAHKTAKNIEDVQCEGISNHVTRRHLKAERLRRADYLHEVRERLPEELPPKSVYKLKGASECVSATDGRKYALKGSMPSAPSCGPCRQSPKPCAVDLVPDNECQIRESGHYLDPCAHRPRTIIHIDRSKQNDNASKINKATSAPCSATHVSPPVTKSSGTTTAAKICAMMKSLTGSAKIHDSGPKGANKSSSCGVTSRAGKKRTNEHRSGIAKRAGDTSWCESLPRPPAATQGCRPMSTSEKIRRRPCPDIKCNPRSSSYRKPSGRRGLHTSVICPGLFKSSSSKAKPANDKLSAVLRERANMNEVAQGRVVNVLEMCNKKKMSEVVTGALEIPVPEGAGTVSVNVEVKPFSEKPGTKKPTPKPGEPDTSEHTARSATSALSGPTTKSPKSNSCKPVTPKISKSNSCKNVASKNKFSKSDTRASDTCISRSGATGMTSAGSPKKNFSISLRNSQKNNSKPDTQTSGACMTTARSKKDSWISLRNLQNKILDSCKTGGNSGKVREKSTVCKTSRSGSIDSTPKREQPIPKSTYIPSCSSPKPPPSLAKKLNTTLCPPPIPAKTKSSSSPTSFKATSCPSSSPSTTKASNGASPWWASYKKSSAKNKTDSSPSSPNDKSCPSPSTPRTPDTKRSPPSSPKPKTDTKSSPSPCSPNTKSSPPPTPKTKNDVKSSPSPSSPNTKSSPRAIPKTKAVPNPCLPSRSPAKPKSKSEPTKKKPTCFTPASVILSEVQVN